MNYRFRVGQMVRVICGPRKGAITTIKSPVLFSTWFDVVTKTDGHGPDWLHELDIPAGERGFNGINAHAVVTWLEPYHEPGDFSTLDELLRGVVPAESVASQNQGALVGAHGGGGR